MKNQALSEDVAIAASQSIKEREYWLNKYSGELVKCTFAYDYVKKKREAAAQPSDAVTFSFSEPIYSQLMTLSKESDYTLHIILTAGLVLLIYRYTDQRDIIIGTPIDKQEEEGDFINTVLALRNQIQACMTFKELLFQVRQTIVEAAANQNYPIETLLYDLNMEFSGDEFPLFDVAVLLENIHDKKYIEHIHSSVTFCFKRTDTGIEVDIDYNPLRYHKFTIERIKDHYVNLLETVLFDLDLEISQLNFLSEEERKQLVEDFNRTHVPYPVNKTIHGLFEEQVEKNPGNIALIYKEEHLTYSKLNQEADRLAALLKQRGVQAGDIVGIMVERSFGMIIGMVGILKAGAAYLPLDPEYPAERLRYMLSDCSVKLLLIGGTTETTDKTIPFEGESINLDAEGQEVEKQAAPKKKKNETANSPAYVIYTSGSTGRPKGVVVLHTSIVNTLLWRKGYYKLDVQDTALQIPSFAFDSSVDDIFTPLISGSKLVLIPQKYRLDLKYLEKTIKKHWVTHYIIVPSFYKTFLDEIHQSLKSVTKVTVAGDNFLENLVREHFEKLPGTTLHNEYGPAETSVCATVYEFKPNKTKIIIGKPIHNVTCYILNSNRALNPMGVPGELFISGSGVAQGYANNPEFTAQKFIPNPFAKGETLYCSGDLARWLPGGNMEFLGRIDHQVKLRGLRIELGEIENLLLKLKEIKEAVVVARRRTRGAEIEDENTSDFLCAYIVADSSMETSKLKEYLSWTLPSYMIPEYFVPLEKIPLNPHGKLDHNALPQPEIKGSQQYVAPRDGVERKLLPIWGEILGIEKSTIGIDGNFFELGGHSLSATTMAFRIHQEFNVNIPLVEILKNPTIRELGEYIKTASEEEYMMINPAEQKEYYELSLTQRRFYIQQQLETESVSYSGPAILILEGSLEREKLEEIFKILIRRNQNLRASFQVVKGRAVQRIHKEVDFSIDYYEAEEEDMDKLIEQLNRPFNLAQAPLMKVALIKVGELKHYIKIDMHHIVMDGITLGLFIKDIMEIYEGKEPPPLKLQYADFSEWQNSERQQEIIRKQGDYWFQQFADGVPELALPIDYTRPKIQRFEGNSLFFEISPEETKELRGLVLQEETSLYTVLFAFYFILLWKLSGQEDIVVGTAVSGRRHPDLMNIMGLFFNTVPIRQSIDGEKTFEAFLKDFKGDVMEVFENQDYPLDKIVEDLTSASLITRRSNRNQLFDTMFSLQNFETQAGSMPEIEIPGLKLIPYKYQPKTAWFDLFFVTLELDDIVSVRVEYSTELFKASTIERINKHYIEIMKQVLKDKTIKLIDITVTSEFLEVNTQLGHDEFLDFGF